MCAIWRSYHRSIWSAVVFQQRESGDYRCGSHLNSLFTQAAGIQTRLGHEELGSELPY